MTLRLAVLVVSVWLFSPLAGEWAWAEATTAPPVALASSPSQGDNAGLELPRAKTAASPDECRCAARKAGLRERVRERKLERERRRREQQPAD